MLGFLFWAAVAGMFIVGLFWRSGRPKPQVTPASYWDDLLAEIRPPRPRPPAGDPGNQTPTRMVEFDGDEAAE